MSARSILVGGVQSSCTSRRLLVGVAVSPVLDTRIQAHLGEQLRTWYGNPTQIRLPRKLARLLNRAVQVIHARTEPIDQEFIDNVLANTPSLRAFAISLTRNGDEADDLVQETVLRAISKRDQFQAGTCLEAWLFTILRNFHFSTHRRSMREVEDADGSYASAMIFVADQDDKIMLQDAEAALRKLPAAQREAIMLVGANGLSYEEAAQVLGCAVGTIKSRVNRARHCLADLMALDPSDGYGHRASGAENARSRRAAHADQDRKRRQRKTG